MFYRKRSRMNSKHKALQDSLTGFVLGELSEEQNHQIQEHLARCAACREQVRRMQKVLDAADCLKAEAVDEAACRQARQNLLEAIEQSDTADVPPGRRWVSSPLVQYAAAAVLLIGALLVLRYLGPDQKLPPPEGLPTHSPPPTQTDRTKKRMTEPLEQERQTAAALFEAGDVRGLEALLHSRHEQTRQAAARYLAQIGDESVLDSLEELARRWEGRSEDNPYRQAAEAIRKRQSEP